jgi:hypothetical protein
MQLVFFLHYYSSNSNTPCITFNLKCLGEG